MRCLKHSIISTLNSIISTLNSIISTLFSLRCLMHCLKQAFLFLGVVYNNVCQVGRLVGWLAYPGTSARTRTLVHAHTHARLRWQISFGTFRCMALRSGDYVMMSAPSVVCYNSYEAEPAHARKQSCTHARTHAQARKRIHAQARISTHKHARTASPPE